VQNSEDVEMSLEAVANLGKSSKPTRPAQPPMFVPPTVDKPPPPKNESPIVRPSVSPRMVRTVSFWQERSKQAGGVGGGVAGAKDLANAPSLQELVKKSQSPNSTPTSAVTADPRMSEIYPDDSSFADSIESVGELTSKTKSAKGPQVFTF
jgi:hypothetical protein